MVLAVILVACAVFGLPGVLICLNLRSRGYGLIPSIGLGMATLVVVFSAAASAVGYSVFLQLGLTVALDVVLLLTLRSRSVGIRTRWLPRLETWQWLLIAVSYTHLTLPTILRV